MRLAALVDTIHAAGRQAHLEVVSLTEGDERNSLQLGRELGFDYVVGGTRWQLGAELLAGTSIRYFPYAGTVIGHPGTLDGTAEQILADIEAMRESVTGVNLLAYRHIRLDGDSLVQEICAVSPIPVLYWMSSGRKHFAREDFDAAGFKLADLHARQYISTIIDRTVRHDPGSRLTASQVIEQLD